MIDLKLSTSNLNEVMIFISYLIDKIIKVPGPIDHVVIFGIPDVIGADLGNVQQILEILILLLKYFKLKKYYIDE